VSSGTLADSRPTIACNRAHTILAQIPGHESQLAINGTVAEDVLSRFPTRSPSGRPVVQQQFVPTAQVAASEKDPVAWAGAFEHYGMVGTWMRMWASPSEGEEVFIFSTHKDALAFQAWASGQSCGYSSLAFSLPHVPGSVGFRIQYASGGYSDQVSFVRGPRRYLVIVPPDTAPSNPKLIARLARHANAHAG
jgi:hypothetical protein